MVMNQVTANAEPNVSEVIVVAIHCDDLVTIAAENGLEPTDICSTYGPMSYPEARKLAMEMIVNGAPTRLNVRFNRYFPVTLPVHEVILTIPNDDPDADEVIETWIARHHNVSECKGLDPHEAGEAY